MDIKEAKSIIASTYPALKVVGIYEYESRYVFQTVPSGYKGDPSKLIDCLTSVDKKTGKVRDFKPFQIPLAEYKAGKKIE